MPGQALVRVEPVRGQSPGRVRTPAVTRAEEPPSTGVALCVAPYTSPASQIQVPESDPSTALPKVFIKTFGCQMNEYDSSKMVDVLKAARGYERTMDIDDADLVLLNTCSVREKASEKVFSDLGRLKAWKAAKPGRLVGVGGCVASQEGDAIAKRATRRRSGVRPADPAPPAGADRSDSRDACVRRSTYAFLRSRSSINLPEPRAEGPTAFVSIMEGCSKYCTFCIVPYTARRRNLPAAR